MTKIPRILYLEIYSFYEVSLFQTLPVCMWVHSYVAWSFGSQVNMTPCKRTIVERSPLINVVWDQTRRVSESFNPADHIVCALLLFGCRRRRRYNCVMLRPFPEALPSLCFRSLCFICAKHFGVVVFGTTWIVTPYSTAYKYDE